MKRLIALCLMLSLLLCACGGKKPEETTAVPTTEVPQTTAEATEATTVPVTQPQLQEAVHPLTGEKGEAPFVNRPLTVSINNYVDALPQFGISQADILYEVETEGGITRCLGVFTDLENIPKIGPVRSARAYFNNITMSYGGVLTHAGGSTYALNANYDATGAQIPGWQHIDAIYTTNGFYRDQDRLNRGVAFEHTLFTGGPGLLANMERFGTTLDAQPDFGLVFDEKAELKDGEAAENLELRFRGTKKTQMTYVADTGLYEAGEYGKPWIDGETEKPLAFRNVIVVKTRQFNPDNYHSMYDLIGSGEGMLAQGGKMVPIHWERKTLESPFRYTLEDGSPVTLGVGNTYVAVMDVSGKITNS